MGTWLHEARVDLKGGEGDSSRVPSSVLGADGAPTLNAKQANAVDIIVQQTRELDDYRTTELATTEARRQRGGRGCRLGCS